MTRRRSSALAAASAVTLMLGGLTIPAAQSSDEVGLARPGQVIRLVERVHDVAFEDDGAPGASLGDRLIFSADIFDELGRLVGRDGAYCVVVRIEPGAPPEEQQVVECVVSLELPEGQLTFQGLAQGLDNIFALTGGTGAYKTARGQAVVHDRIFLHEAELTIEIHTRP